MADILFLLAMGVVISALADTGRSSADQVVTAVPSTGDRCDVVDVSDE